MDVLVSNWLIWLSIFIKCFWFLMLYISDIRLKVLLKLINSSEVMTNLYFNKILK